MKICEKSLRLHPRTFQGCALQLQRLCDEFNFKVLKILRFVKVFQDDNIIINLCAFYYPRFFMSMQLFFSFPEQSYKTLIVPLFFYYPTKLFFLLYAKVPEYFVCLLNFYFPGFLCNNEMSLFCARKCVDVVKGFHFVEVDKAKRNKATYSHISTRKEGNQRGFSAPIDYISGTKWNKKFSFDAEILQKWSFLWHPILLIWLL